MRDSLCRAAIRTAGGVAAFVGRGTDLCRGARGIIPGMKDNGPHDEGRLVSELATRVGTLGVELADVAGNLEEVADHTGASPELQFREFRFKSHKLAVLGEFERVTLVSQL